MNRFAKKFIQSTVISGVALSLFSVSAIAEAENKLNAKPEITVD